MITNTFFFCCWENVSARTLGRMIGWFNYKIHNWYAGESGCACAGSGTRVSLPLWMKTNHSRCKKWGLAWDRDGAQLQPSAIRVLHIGRALPWSMLGNGKHSEVQIKCLLRERERDHCQIRLHQADGTPPDGTIYIERSSLSWPKSWCIAS